MTTSCKCRGFTLAELIISLGIIAIILSAAVPSVANIIKDNRMAAQLNAMIGAISLARSEATKRDTRIILCRSADPNHANPTCGGTANNWTSGYLVFTGEDGNNSYNSGTDTLLHRGQPANNGIVLRTTDTWNNNLEINPIGTLNESGTAIMAMCDERGNTYGRQITIPLTGKPRLKTGNINNCTP